MATHFENQSLGIALVPKPARITKRYLLVTNVPLYRDDEGHMYAGQLWFKDLSEHLSYIDSFALACPILTKVPAEPVVSLNDDSHFSKIKIFCLPAPVSLLRAVLAFPRTGWRLFRAVLSAEVIHAGIAGWPIPYGWIVSPVARIAGKKLIIIVESAPWRLKSGVSYSFKSRIVAKVFERLGRWSVSKADLAIFTQNEYRQSLLSSDAAKGHVIHASWIDDGIIMSDTHAEAVWDQKVLRNPQRLAILFAGRLDPHKGVAVLLDAIMQLARKDIAVTLDILGAGDLVERCREVSAQLRGSTQVNLLGTVEYGGQFFELLQRYHAVVLPSISDEQPRIVYDAYSQGLPALASGTAGLRDCVHENQTGWFFEPNCVDQLSAMIERAAENVPDLRRMGMRALQMARSMTHQRMHLERQLLLLKLTQGTTGK